MALNPRQSFNVFTAIQLDRIKRIVSLQTPPELHALPAAPLIQSALNGRSGKERSARSAKPQILRANRRAWCELTDAERRKREYNTVYWRRKKTEERRLLAAMEALTQES